MTPILKGLLLSLATCSIAFSANASPKGVFIAPLLSDRFPVNKTVEILSDTDRPAFSFVDFSFGSNYQNVKDVLDGLLYRDNPPSDITVIVYVECGPCRPPRRPTGFFPLAPAHLSIPQLNKRLKLADVSVVQYYIDRLAFLHSQQHPDPRVHYIYERGLEDNFDSGSIAVIDALLAQEFSNDVQVTLGENPLNQAQHRHQTVREWHQTTLGKAKAGDIVNLDGFGFCYRGERGCRGLEYSATERLLKAARARGVAVLLWRPEWQDATNPPKRESKRKYRITNVRQLKRLLRR